MSDFVPIDELFESEADRYLLPKERADARRGPPPPSARSEVPDRRPDDLRERERLNTRRKRAGLAKPRKRA